MAPADAAWPRDVDGDCLATLQHLLAKDPAQRLRADKAADSRWFATVDAAALDAGPGPLEPIAAVIVECAAMEADDADDALRALFEGSDATQDVVDDDDAFAGFARGPSLCARPSLSAADGDDASVFV